MKNLPIFDNLLLTYDYTTGVSYVLFVYWESDGCIHWRRWALLTNMGVWAEFLDSPRVFSAWRIYDGLFWDGLAKLRRCTLFVKLTCKLFWIGRNLLNSLSPTRSEALLSLCIGEFLRLILAVVDTFDWAPAIIYFLIEAS